MRIWLTVPARNGSPCLPGYLEVDDGYERGLFMRRIRWVHSHRKKVGL